MTDMETPVTTKLTYPDASLVGGINIVPPGETLTWELPNCGVILITGSCTWPDQHRLAVAVNNTIDLLSETNSTILMIEGGAKGADSMAADAFDAYSMGTPREMTRYRCHPDWDPWGRAAGFKRNEYMVQLATFWQDQGAEVHMLAFIHNGSNGATHTLQRAKSAGLHGTIHRSTMREG